MPADGRSGAVRSAPDRSLVGYFFAVFSSLGTLPSCCKIVKYFELRDAFYENRGGIYLPASVKSVNAAYNSFNFKTELRDAFQLRDALYRNLGIYLPKER